VFAFSGIGREAFGIANQLYQAGCVFTENWLLAAAVLQAGEIFLDQWGLLFRQAVNHPLRMALTLDQTPAAHVGEVPRHLHLRLAQDCLNVTNAKRPAQEEVGDAQAGSIAQALVDSDQFHTALYICQCKYA